MKLLIVESPAKKQTISKYLGPGWRVEASMGHICDLPQKELGVLPPQYKPLYELTERGKQTINRLKGASKGIESVWLATDPDREGEAIAGHIARYLKGVVSTFYRVVFHEITEKALKVAVANPRKLDRALFEAQQARRVIDRLVGYQVSPRLCQITNQRLSAGRVQSVAIRLLVEREREIRAFKPTNHFGVRLHFNTHGVRWYANWDTTSFVKEDLPYVLERSLAEEVAKITEVVVLEVDKKKTQRKAPPPFITTTLQKAASIQLGLAPEETMRLAQMLFEKGFITYHRTDNPNLSKEAIQDIQSELKALSFKEHIASPSNRWKGAKEAQEAHEAIRPTQCKRLETGLLGHAQKLYELIRIRALASQMAATQLETTKVVLVPRDEKQDIQGITPRFVAKGIQTLYPGWRLLIPHDLAEEKDKEDGWGETLPKLKAKTLLLAEQGEVLELKTQAPKRYTEPALITKLEKEGIGRPSTYASILSNIKQRAYVKLNGKLFEAMPSAETIYDALVGRFQFMEVAYTRAMEASLDAIAEGKEQYIEVVRKADNELQQSLKGLALTGGGKSCPKCQAPMREINGKHGRFWGCTRYQEGCKGTLSNHQALASLKPKQIDRVGANASLENSEHSCPKCHKALRRISGKKGYFWACSDSLNCKLTLDDKRGKPVKFY